jgi:hypothetical protein
MTRKSGEALQKDSGMVRERLLGYGTDSFTYLVLVRMFMK